MESTKSLKAASADRIVTIIPSIVRGIWNRCQSELPIKLTWGQFSLLALLSQQSHTLTELAREWGVSKPSMSKMVSWQVEREWVVRIIEPSDSRRKPLHLTPAGRKVHEQAHKVLVQNLAHALEQLTDEQSAQIKSAIDVLFQILV